MLDDLVSGEVFEFRVFQPHFSQGPSSALNMITFVGSTSLANWNLNEPDQQGTTMSSPVGRALYLNTQQFADQLERVRLQYKTDRRITRNDEVSMYQKMHVHYSHLYKLCGCILVFVSGATSVFVQVL
jgi:hypothetical protein